MIIIISFNVDFHHSFGSWNRVFFNIHISNNELKSKRKLKVFFSCFDELKSEFGKNLRDRIKQIISDTRHEHTQKKTKWNLPVKIFYWIETKIFEKLCRNFLLYKMKLANTDETKLKATWWICHSLVHVYTSLSKNLWANEKEKNYHDKPDSKTKPNQTKRNKMMNKPPNVFYGK